MKRAVRRADEEVGPVLHLRERKATMEGTTIEIDIFKPAYFPQTLSDRHRIIFWGTKNVTRGARKRFAETLGISPTRVVQIRDAIQLKRERFLLCLRANKAGDRGPYYRYMTKAMESRKMEERAMVVKARLLKQDPDYYRRM